MNKKVVIGILVLLLLLVGLGVGVFLVRQQQEIRKKAAPASSIAILPSTKTVNSGEEFTLSVELNTATNEIRGAELHITFDANLLSLRDFLPSTTLPTVFVSPRVDNTAGTASITLGAQPSNLFSGKDVIATLRFQAKTAGGTANVNFAPQTLATGLSESQDVLVSKNGARVTVLVSAPTPTPSLDAQGGTAGSATAPTPTPTQGLVGGGATATPTPTKVATGSGSSTGSATQTQPVAGVSLPIVLSLAAGAFLLILGIALAL